MKSSLKIALSAALFLVISVTSFSQKKPQFFTAKDASNWFYVLNDKKLNATDVFKMKDGVLSVTGESSGYLRTKKSYKNFMLSLEWRWTKVLANSGVLVHIQQKDTVWPVCYQVQQKADAAGDIICMNGLWAKECTDSIKFTVKKMQPSNERPLGEWNSMKIVSKNKTLKVWVNGVLQNNITGLTASKGFIGFQNEGKPIEFRNLFLKSEK
ncbi:MAG TPA: DUF1080 domain-containing protein [Paludibacter sp.]|nr:DUF1080 domain-containing protein [Paludibacter sp.]